ncbi:MAG TPA: YceI family protein [Polyangia bacterium]|nr:YceI family protein [Polyangia bacterium]
MTTTTSNPGNASVWNIDPAHSGVNFSIRHMVVAKVRGRFTKFSGTVSLDEADLTRSVIEASIDTASIDTSTAQRDEHLRSADFFDVARFPEIRFHSARVERLASDRYRVVGALTIKEATREIALDVEFGGRATDPWGNQRAGFSAKGSIDRKDFGLNWNQVLEAGGLLVGDRVDIELEVQAVKAAATKAA